MASASAFTPAGEPESRRKFQLTNLDGNNNKYYVVDVWPAGGEEVFFRATYGRVGASAQVDERLTTRPWVERKIREKVAKGYQEVLLHRPEVVLTAPATATPVAPKVKDLVDVVFAEAGRQIASFLAVDVDALSPRQISAGRSLLLEAQRQFASWSASQAAGDFAALAATVQRFYNAIPTQLSARIARDQVVLNFCKEIAEQEDRLKQLEAAVATANARQGNPHVSLYDALGADIMLLPQNDRCYGEVHDYIARTAVHGYQPRVRDIFAVAVPQDRSAFAQNTAGRRKTALLFHGTANQNVCHILRSGLICPRVASNGRMFGDGIYFANKCTKSTNYCRASGAGAPHMLFLAEVALGRQYVARDAMPGLKAAPDGYDSVWGKPAWTWPLGGGLRFDEFIVYNAAQQSLRYLVTFDR